MPEYASQLTADLLSSAMEINYLFHETSTFWLYRQILNEFPLLYIMLNGIYLFTCYEIVREILTNKNLNIAEYVVMEEMNQPD